jgi:hypothetical protein
MEAGRKNFVSDNPGSPTADEATDAVTKYFAYAGPFDVNERARTLY